MCSVCQCTDLKTYRIPMRSLQGVNQWNVQTQERGRYFSFSVLCLTTDLVHQGHERRKKKKSTAQHVRPATRSIKCERQWRHVALETAGPIPFTNNMAAYQFSVSASYKQYVSDECTYNIQSRQKHNMLSLLHAACLKLLVLVFNFYCLSPGILDRTVYMLPSSQKFTYLFD